MRIRTVIAGTAALALLAGCSSGGGTTGTPTSAPQPTSTSNGGGAPKVSNPLTLTAFEAAPCTAVTAAQLTAFGLPGVTGRLNNSSAGTGCNWSGSLTAAEMAGAMIILSAGTNLESIYAKKDSTYPVFEPQPAIQGYPATVALLVDQRKEGDCDMIVGVSDERAILFTFSSSGQKSKYFANPCTGATEFANLAITTIKAGAK